MRQSVIVIVISIAFLCLSGWSNAASDHLNDNVILQSTPHTTQHHSSQHHSSQHHSTHHRVSAIKHAKKKVKHQTKHKVQHLQKKAHHLKKQVNARLKHQIVALQHKAKHATPAQKKKLKAQAKHLVKKTQKLVHKRVQAIKHHAKATLKHKQHKANKLGKLKHAIKQKKKKVLTLAQQYYVKMKAAHKRNTAYMNRLLKEAKTTVATSQKHIHNIFKAHSDKVKKNWHLEKKHKQLIAKHLSAHQIQMKSQTKNEAALKKKTWDKLKKFRSKLSKDVTGTYTSIKHTKDKMAKHIKHVQLTKKDLKSQLTRAVHAAAKAKSRLDKEVKQKSQLHATIKKVNQAHVTVKTLIGGEYNIKKQTRLLGEAKKKASLKKHLTAAAQKTKKVNVAVKKTVEKTKIDFSKVQRALVALSKRNKQTKDQAAKLVQLLHKRHLLSSRLLKADKLKYTKTILMLQKLKTLERKMKLSDASLRKTHAGRVKEHKLKEKISKEKRKKHVERQHKSHKKLLGRIKERGRKRISAQKKRHKERNKKKAERQRKRYGKEKERKIKRKKKRSERIKKRSGKRKERIRKPKKKVGKDLGPHKNGSKGGEVKGGLPPVFYGIIFPKTGAQKARESYMEDTFNFYGTNYTKGLKNTTVVGNTFGTMRRQTQTSRLCDGDPPNGPKGKGCDSEAYNAEPWYGWGFKGPPGSGGHSNSTIYGIGGKRFGGGPPGGPGQQEAKWKYVPQTYDEGAGPVMGPPDQYGGYDDGHGSRVTLTDSYDTWCDLHSPFQNPFCPYTMIWFLFLNLVIKVLVPAVTTVLVDNVCPEFMAGQEAPINLVENILIELENKVKKPTDIIPEQYTNTNDTLATLSRSDLHYLKMFNPFLDSTEISSSKLASNVAPITSQYSAFRLGNLLSSGIHATDQIVMQGQLLEAERIQKQNQPTLKHQQSHTHQNNQTVMSPKEVFDHSRRRNTSINEKNDINHKKTNQYNNNYNKNQTFIHDFPQVFVKHNITSHHNGSKYTIKLNINPFSPNSIETRDPEKLPKITDFKFHKMEDEYWKNLDERLTTRFKEKYNLDLRNHKIPEIAKIKDRQKDFDPMKLVPDNHVPLRIVFDEEMSTVLWGAPDAHKTGLNQEPRFVETGVQTALRAKSKALGKLAWHFDKIHYEQKPSIPDNTRYTARHPARQVGWLGPLVGTLRMGIYIALVHPLTNKLADTITRDLTKSATPILFDKLQDELKEFLRISLVHSLTHTVLNTIPLTVGETVPESLEAVLPIQFALELTSSLINTLTRGLTHTVGLTLIHAMRGSNRARFFCYYCHQFKEFCEECKRSEKGQDLWIGLYYGNHYGSYYSDYYAPKYAWGVFTDVMRQHPIGTIDDPGNDY